HEIYTYGTATHPVGTGLVSPDFTRIAFESQFQSEAQDQSQTVTIISPHRTIATLQSPEGEAIAGFSPDSSLLATAARTNNGIHAEIWNARNGELVTS